MAKARRKGAKRQKADDGSTPVEENPPAAPSASALKAAAEKQVPLEGRGPGVEHEDHEGGITDSLAKKGVRAPLPTAEERAELENEQETIIRAPSVRDRQTGMGALVAEGGVRRRDAGPGEKGRKSIPVIARRLGQYPADGRLRAPGEAFIYVMGPNEEKLPSWMEDPTGSIETRGENEPSGAVPDPLVIEVQGVSGGDVRVRRGARSTAA